MDESLMYLALWGKVQGKVKPVIAKRLPLVEVVSAHTLLEDGDIERIVWNGGASEYAPIYIPKSTKVRSHPGRAKGERRILMKHKALRITLVIIEACIGLSAIGGGIALLLGTMGQLMPVAFLHGTPFHDYTIPGLVLTVVVGGGMLLLAAVTLFIQREWVMFLSMVMGLIMLVFEIVEVAIIDRYAQAVIPSTVVLQALFSVLGLVIIGLSASVWMTEYRGQHVPLSHA